MGKVFNKSKIHTKNAETKYPNKTIAKITGQKFNPKVKLLLHIRQNNHKKSYQKT